MVPTEVRESLCGCCRSQLECLYLHSEKVCDNVLLSGKCSESKRCLQRHPRDCKYWMGDTRGCLRGQECKYLHNPSKEGKNIRPNKNCHETKSEGQNKMKAKEVKTEKHDDKTIISLKDIVASKDKEIKEKDDKVQKLVLEKEDLINQNNKIKRCAKNMDEEIKRLRSRTN